MTEKEIWEKLSKMHEELIKVRIDIATLKVKSGIWGFAAGLVPAIGILLMGLAKQ